MNYKQQNSSSSPHKSHRDYGKLFKTIEHSYSQYSHKTNRNPQNNNLEYLKSKQLQSRFKNGNKQNPFFSIDEPSNRSVDQPKIIKRSRTNNYLRLPMIKSRRNLEQRITPYNKINIRNSYLIPTLNSVLRQKQLRDPHYGHKSICSVNCQRNNNQKRSKSKKVVKKDESPRIRQYFTQEAEANYPETQLNRYLSRIKLQEDQKRSKLIYQTYFGIQPQFYKLQTEYAKQLSQQMLNRSLVKQQKIRAQIPIIPAQQELPQFIQEYSPYSKEIDLQTLMKSPRFFIEYSKNELFFGQMIGNQKQGIGIAIESGKVFEGVFRNNFKVKGVQINASGTYKGLFFNQKRNGDGQFQWLNGQYYIGEWKDGNRHGVGVWTNRFCDSYNGQWKIGKGEGYGVYIVAGQEYKGTFVDFRKEGWGKQSFINGDSFEGQFRQGLPEGKGRYKWQNGTKYEGQFITGLRNRKGTLKTRDGFIYKGQFLDERPQGLCQIYMPNGDTYHGYFKEGRKNGRGTLFLQDSQKVLDGYWRDDNFIEPISK